MKKLMLIIFVLSLNVSFAQWNNLGDWPNSSYTGGTHGITVDPDGKVWTASHYKHDDWVTEPDSIIIKTSAILIFNPDGTEVEFSPIHFVETNNSSQVDTLNGNCRGLSTDEKGNILYVQSGPGKILKIDYKTGEGIARKAIDSDLGTSPTKAAVADDGTIFVGPVVSSGVNPIVMYTPELDLLGNAMIGPPGVSRTMEVSPDGNTIYWMAFDINKMYILQRPDFFTAFSIIDSLDGYSIESSAWQPGTNNLWISNDANGDFAHLTWYAYDVENKSITESFAWSPNSNTSELARGIDFSPDGSVAYIGTFEVSTSRLQKIELISTDVENRNNLIPDEISLEQNYPNPFNPSTQIEFSIPSEGFVTLSVFNLQGEKVSSLVNEKLNTGNYTVNFNGEILSSGMYFYVLNYGTMKLIKKMMLLK